MQCQHHSKAIARGKVAKQCKRQATVQGRRGVYCAQHGFLVGATKPIEAR